MEHPVMGLIARIWESWKLFLMLMDRKGKGSKLIASEKAKEICRIEGHTIDRTAWRPVVHPNAMVERDRCRVEKESQGFGILFRRAARRLEESWWESRIEAKKSRRDWRRSAHGYAEARLCNHTFCSFIAVLMQTYALVLVCQLYMPMPLVGSLSD